MGAGTFSVRGVGGSAGARWSEMTCTGNEPDDTFAGGFDGMLIRCVGAHGFPKESSQTANALSRFSPTPSGLRTADRGVIGAQFGTTDCKVSSMLWCVNEVTAGN